MKRSVLAQQYVESYGEAESVRIFAADLMRGDPAVFKRGYDRANAVIAAAEAFDLPRERVEELVP